MDQSRSLCGRRAGIISCQNQLQASGTGGCRAAPLRITAAICCAGVQQGPAPGQPAHLRNHTTTGPRMLPWLQQGAAGCTAEGLLGAAAARQQPWQADRARPSSPLRRALWMGLQRVQVSGQHNLLLEVSCVPG
ncbi:hypothetical protein ABPG75_004658 [Micractinium tetrahymenae]